MATLKDLLNKYPRFDNKGNRHGRTEPVAEPVAKKEVRKARKPRVSDVASTTEKKDTESE